MTTVFPRHRRERASVLVIVLVTVLFAAAALVAFIDKASDDLIVESRESAGRRLRQEAYSALEVTLAVLDDFRQVNGGLRSTAEGWGQPLEFAGWTPREGCVAEISFEDESGKLSLPRAELGAFKNLFESWGLSQGDTERLTDALLGWMRKDHVAASAWTPDYEQGALPYGPPLRSLRSYSELAAIDYARELFYDESGRPNELWHRFANSISLYDFKETNLNGLRGDTLGALGGMESSQQRRFEDYLKGAGERERLGPGYFENAADAARVLGTEAPAGYGTQISALRVNITLREGRTEFRLSAVVAPPGGAKPVQQTAERTTLAAANTNRNETTAAKTEPTTAAQAKKLNYPFTLLEIKENAEILTAPVPPPPA